MLQIKSKFKIAKRLGSGIFEQTQTQKFALSEARSRKVRRRPRALSDYGKQLLEKQKVRYTYGLSEKQFRALVKEAMESGEPAKRLHVLLESRLDNVVYRLGFAPTRRAARQMVSHGHIVVNGKKTTIPSQRTKVGDALAVREGSRDSVLFSEIGGEGSMPTPNWLKLDAKNLSGSIGGEPPYAPHEMLLDYPAVFEFYSR